MSHHTHILNVLFLCTGNSARSIFAECLMNRWGAGKLKGHSAGSHPRGEIHPRTLHELKVRGYHIEGLRSKSWDEFTHPHAPLMDFVITVCDNAAGESCPIWPGQPMVAHWGIADPVAVRGDELTEKTAFATAFRELQHRVSILASLPLKSLDKLRLQQRINDIGRTSSVIPNTFSENS